MDNIQHCVQTVLDDDVPGDLIEAGVWRGGACIFMKANLLARGDTDPRRLGGRLVPGPAPAERGPVPRRHRRRPAHPQRPERRRRPGPPQLRALRRARRAGPVPGRLVQGHAADRPDRGAVGHAPRRRHVRVDWQAIEALYPKLSPGGFCIIDDFGSHQSQAGQAVHDYRKANGIDEEIVDIDGFGAYWRRRALPHGPKSPRPTVPAGRDPGGAPHDGTKGRRPVARGRSSDAAAASLLGTGRAPSLRARPATNASRTGFGSFSSSVVICTVRRSR